MVRRSSSAWLECQPVTLEVEGSSPFCVVFASIAQSVEQRTENPRVAGSIPARGIQFYMRKWLSGRASPCQGEGREFESRLPLQVKSKVI